MKLRQSIEFGTETVGELTFRPGRIGDIKGMKVDGIPNVDQLLLIASRMCGKPVAALELLGPEDGAEVLEVAMSFFGKCLGAGGTPSQ